MILKNKLLNGWYLFALITIPICIAVLIRASALDMSGARDISSMIQFSVRCSVPWLYLAFAASALFALSRTEFSRWLMRNRRNIGLCFATAMGWQLFFIVMMVATHWTYFMEEVYLLTDIVVQIPGYLFLLAMTLTSFRPGRSWLNQKHWKILHKTAIYFLWGTVWSTYWYELYYYNDIQTIDFIFYWTGFAAWGLRLTAWTRKQYAESAGLRPAYVILGSSLVLPGLVGVTFGSLWAPATLASFAANDVARNLELIIPFLPILPVAGYRCFYP
jgi:hypothetical protein